ncbi:MAG: hypothetical protein AAFQ63_09635 [Cyanobacteria bacterium J06621_11]
MTLDAIDQALNVAIVGLVYGSGAWFACAFGLSVVSKRHRQSTDTSTAVLPPAAKSLSTNLAIVSSEASFSEVLLAPADDTLIENECVNAANEQYLEPSIEIIIEQSAPGTTVVKTLEPKHLKTEKTVAKAAASKKTISQKTISQKTIQQALINSKADQTEDSEATSKVRTAHLKITCEPIDWKKWKVADLRKASIANVCGVRTRPIGSKRNLRKVDLIAQYEQQLKRLTKAAPQLHKKEEDVA